jgi:tetratricopeptide (TPR) repeat protein
MTHHGLDYLDIPKHRSHFHYRHAEILLKDGQNYHLELERILKELNRAANLTPEEPKIYLALAEVYRRALDTSSAIFALRFALEKDSTNLRARKQLCELLINRAQETMKLGTHYDRASNYFDDALEMDPTRCNIWILKAVCDIHCSNFTQALHAINRAINISTSITIDMYILRAKILWALGQIDAGNKDMRKVIAIDNSHPEVMAFIHRAFANAESQYLEAYKLFQQKKSQDGIKILLTILEVNQNDLKLYLLLSKLYRQNLQLDLAYKTLTTAVGIYQKLDPYQQYTKLVKAPDEIFLQQNIILNEMAMKCAVEGEYQQAIILLNKAIASERKLRKDPNEINFRFFLNRGDCYRALGESMYAVADYQLALERCPGEHELLTFVDTICLSLSLFVSLSLYLSFAHSESLSPFPSSLLRQLGHHHQALSLILQSRR